MSLFTSLNDSPSTPGAPNSVLQRIKGRDPKAPNSIALIASVGGDGVILEWHGNDIYWEFEGEGCLRTDFHGMDDAPDGLSIWEGKMCCDQGYEDPVPDCSLEGEYRDLTPEEWKLLQDTGVPWELEPCDVCKQVKCTCDGAAP